MPRMPRSSHRSHIRICHLDLQSLVAVVDSRCAVLPPSQRGTDAAACRPRFARGFGDGFRLDGGGQPPRWACDFTSWTTSTLSSTSEPLKHRPPLGVKDARAQLAGSTRRDYARPRGRHALGEAIGLAGGSLGAAHGRPWHSTGVHSGGPRPARGRDPTEPSPSDQLRAIAVRARDRLVRRSPYGITSGNARRSGRSSSRPSRPGDTGP